LDDENVSTIAAAMDASDADGGSTRFGSTRALFPRKNELPERNECQPALARL
jgi:hypothetical protein